MLVGKTVRSRAILWACIAAWGGCTTADSPVGLPPDGTTERQDANGPAVVDSSLPPQEGTLVSQLIAELRASTSGEGWEVPLVLGAWIDASLRDSLEAKPTNAEESLETLVGECGLRDLLMREVLTAFGYASRRVNFGGIPVQVGHSATEVLLDGKWVLIDSEIGGYFARPDALMTPLSVAEAREAFPNVHLMKSTLPSWQRKWVSVDSVVAQYRAGHLFAKYESNVIHNAQDPSVAVFYVRESYLTSRYANDDKPEMIFMLPIALDTASAGTFGTVDQSANDLEGFQHTAPGTSFYHPFLATLGCWSWPSPCAINVVDQLQLVSAQPRRITLELSFVSPVGEEARKRLVVGIDTPSRPILDAPAGAPVIRWAPSSVEIETDIVPPITLVTLRVGADPAGRPPGLVLDRILWK